MITLPTSNRDAYLAFVHGGPERGFCGNIPGERVPFAPRYSMKSHRSGGSTDGFSAFLRTVKAAERNLRQEDSGTFASAGAEPDRSDFRRRMLKILRTRGAVPVPELLKETNLNFSDFTEALQAATRNELVRLHLEDGAEMAELTPLGHKLASIE